MILFFIKKLYYYGNYIAFAFRYYNYQFIPTECNEKLYFYYAIEFGHLRLVEYYKNIEGLNINEPIIHELFLKIISKQNFFAYITIYYFTKTNIKNRQGYIYFNKLRKNNINKL